MGERILRLVCSHAVFHIRFTEAVFMCPFMGGSGGYGSVDVHFVVNDDCLLGTGSS